MLRTVGHHRSQDRRRFPGGRWGVSNATVERPRGLRKMHWACQLGRPNDSQRHIFSSVMVTEARLSD